ncbi:hypothetical protein NFI96_019656, partial [Prochilodus magdalenae]
VLKPVIEKKRRDRINQRLDELRTLLLDNTLDTRLQNPKLEKAEILELTVDYIRKKTNTGKENSADFEKESVEMAGAPLTARKPRLPCITLHDPTKLQANNPLYTAGFQECISRLASFVDCVEPSQRENFIQGLRHHLDSHTNRVPSHLWASGTPEPFPYAGSPQLYPNSFVLHHPHASGQALSHPYPSPPYSLSPPPSPCYSSTSPAFSTSPTYLSVPCHFPFPPSVSPLSDSSSSSSFATSTPAATIAAPPQPPSKAGPPTPLRPAVPTVPTCPQQRTLRRALFQNQQQNIWRPW